MIGKSLNKLVKVSIDLTHPFMIKVLLSGNMAKLFSFVGVQEFAIIPFNYISNKIMDRRDSFKLILSTLHFHYISN